MEESKAVGSEIDLAVLNDVKAKEFTIVSMRMKDAEKGQVLWEEADWDLTTDEEKESASSPSKC